MKEKPGIWTLGMLAAAVMLMLPVAASSAAEKPAGKAKLQTNCPVTGNPIEKELHVDKDGKRIYVCCPKCIDPVKADFDKIATDLEAKGITLAHAQTTCPVMGGAIDKNLYVDKDGKRIYVCCTACIGKVKADFDKCAAQLEAKGQYLETPNPKPAK